jgi:hypothetical protein
LPGGASMFVRVAVAVKLLGVAIARPIAFSSCMARASVHHGGRRSEPPASPDRRVVMDTRPPSAFDALSDTLRPHAERWALQLIEVPDAQVPRILERLLRDVMESVDADYTEDNVDEIKEWLRLVGHAIVERRQELLLRGCRSKGKA